MSMLEKPPSLPRGWVANWDEEYEEYYFVDTRTGEAQWELPYNSSSLGSSKASKVQELLKNQQEMIERQQQQLEKREMENQPPKSNGIGCVIATTVLGPGFGNYLIAKHLITGHKKRKASRNSY